MSEPETEPDAESLFADLTSVLAGNRDYKPLDRHQDFRAVFLGSDQGRRVLHEIMALGHFFRATSSRARFESNRAFFYDGERSLAARIYAITTIEPALRPTKTNPKPT